MLIIAIFALLVILATVIGLDELDTYEDFWQLYGGAPSYLDLLDEPEVVIVVERTAELPLDSQADAWLMMAMA